MTYEVILHFIKILRLHNVSKCIFIDFSRSVHREIYKNNFMMNVLERVSLKFRSPW